MQLDQPPSRNLSEIGHLFLSSVRERQTNGAPMPRRQPPAAGTDVPHLGAGVSDTKSPIPLVSVVLGAPVESAKRYARHLAGGGARVGMIEVDAAELRLTCFERRAEESMEVESALPESLDPRAAADALEEMNCDLDRWLLVLPSPRLAEARALLAAAGHWVLLAACDPDGVVACYRSLKGALAGPNPPTAPSLSLAVLDPDDDREGAEVHKKLEGVCRQFLNVPLIHESAVRTAEGVTECVALDGRAREGGSAAHWKVVFDFLARSRREKVTETPPEVIAPSGQPSLEAPAPKPALEVSDPMSNPTPPPAIPAPRATIPFPQATVSTAPAMRWAGNDADRESAKAPFSEVIELPEGATTGGSILAAILRNESTELVECPVTPPMCAEAKLAVTRDRRVVLLAAARQGLGELRSIGRAYNWLVENYRLICMAMPQMAIDPAASPCLRLLIDHADLSAEILQPMLQASTVKVQAYRRLRWGAKTGLLLEAA